MVCTCSAIVAFAMATAGDDFAPYKDRMLKQGLPVEHIKIIEGAFTAQAFITTDMDDNQITAFHPGAMQFAHSEQGHRCRPKELALGLSLRMAGRP